ncbi:MAG: histidinol-phosphatase, partial [Chitinophagaceae bacterium]
MKRILFIDRDGVVLQEPPTDFQVDSLEKTSFVPGAISALAAIAADMDYYKVMVTNQDGLGTASYPEETFWPYHNLMTRTLEGEGFVFDEMIIDRTFAADNAPTRKPGTGLLQHFFDQEKFDLANSYVIGDRWSDIQLAKNLCCKAIYFISELHPLSDEYRAALGDVIAFETNDWKAIYSFLKLGLRKVAHERNTHETKIHVSLNLDGSGQSAIQTGLGFFDHMLD